MNRISYEYVTSHPPYVGGYGNGRDLSQSLIGRGRVMNELERAVSCYPQRALSCYPQRALSCYVQRGLSCYPHRALSCFVQRGGSCIYREGSVIISPISTVLMTLVQWARSDVGLKKSPPPPRAPCGGVRIDLPRKLCSRVYTPEYTVLQSIHYPTSVINRSGAALRHHHETLFI